MTIIVIVPFLSVISFVLDGDFFYESLHDKNNKENERQSVTFASNPELNYSITINEVE